MEVSLLLEDWTTPPLLSSSPSSSASLSSSFPFSSVSSASPFSSWASFSWLCFSSSLSSHRSTRMKTTMMKRWTKKKKRSFFCASSFVFSHLREKQRRCSLIIRLPLVSKRANLIFKLPTSTLVRCFLWSASTPAAGWGRRWRWRRRGASPFLLLLVFFLSASSVSWSAAIHHRGNKSRVNTPGWRSYKRSQCVAAAIEVVYGSAVVFKSLPSAAGKTLVRFLVPTLVQWFGGVPGGPQQKGDFFHYDFIHK